MFSSFFRTAQPFTTVTFVNNTKEKFADFTLKIEDVKKETIVPKIGKGDVKNIFLTTSNLTGLRDVFLKHGDKEYLLFEKFNCENITKIKVRIQGIDDNGSLKLEAFIDKE